jgi:hypothetical protein
MRYKTEQYRKELERRHKYKTYGKTDKQKPVGFQSIRQCPDTGKSPHPEHEENMIGDGHNLGFLRY